MQNGHTPCYKYSVYNIGKSFFMVNFNVVNLELILIYCYVVKLACIILFKLIRCFTCKILT